MKNYQGDRYSDTDNANILAIMGICSKDTGAEDLEYLLVLRAVRESIRGIII